jgi:hypothetical protein
VLHGRPPYPYLIVRLGGYPWYQTLSSPCFGTFTTSLELSLILLMRIKMVVHECNLGHHLTDCQGVVVAHQGVATARQGVAANYQGATTTR